jgi:glycosyltransferase involved in cell wall biosynthesis
VTTSRPFCSVVVPTRDRPTQLRIGLESLARLDFPHDRFEVIVVDDGGAAPLDSLLASFRGTIDVRLLRQDWTGPAAARNFGAARARGELLAFTDDDCAPRRDWRARREDAIGGLTVNALPANRYSTAAQMIIDAGYAQRNYDSSAFPFFTANNLAVPAEGFRQLGGFDSRYITSEDREFCARWAGRGWRIAYEPEAVVEHSHPLTFWRFCRLYFAYGCGAFRFRHEQARKQRPVPFEPAFYLRTLPRHAFAGRSPIEGVTLLSLLVPWHVANATGFVWEWLRGGSRGVRGRALEA